MQVTPYDGTGITPTEHDVLLSRLRAARPRRYLVAFFAAAGILAPLMTGMAPNDAAARQSPLIAGNQFVVYYGAPNAPMLGVLGTFPAAQDAAVSLAGETALVDSLNGDRGAKGAMDLIFGMVTADPGPDGIYVRYLDDGTTRQYIDRAAEHDEQVVLDMQIGRGTVLAEVKKLEPYLLKPNVHVAIDPEYAVGPDGIPIQDAGRISGDDINQAQQYLSELVTDHGLPPKLLVVHQYMDDTIQNAEAAKTYDGVDLVVNVDGIGAPDEKAHMYQHFAAQPWAHRRAYTVFLKQDAHIPSEQELLAMQPAPDMILFQ